MNRSLLIVICDFLLLSLLALARFDEPEEAQPPPQAQQAQADIDPAERDLLAALRMSLESEQVEREQLTADLEERARALEEERRRAEELARTSSVLEGERERLERLRQQLEEDRARLAGEVTQTREQLQMTSEERARLRENIAAAQERQRMLQEQLQAREQALAEERQRAQQLQQQREEAERERAILSTRLEAASVAQQRMEGEITTLRSERQAAQEQAQRLATNVGELAQAQQTTRQELTQEIRLSTPLSSNQIFDRFLRSRVPAGFTSSESALLGPLTHNYAPYSVLVESPDGSIHALMEASETPFVPSNLDQVRAVSGQLQVGRQRLDIAEVGFLQSDPRIVAVPVTQAQAEAAGIKPYNLEQNPMRFQEVVVVQAVGDRYAEASVKLDPSAPGYLRVPTSVTNRIFGSFSPSRGDLVFSKNGDLIGFMVSNGRAVILRSTALAARMPIGNAFSPGTATLLEPALESRIPPEA